MVRLTPFTTVLVTLNEAPVVRLLGLLEGPHSVAIGDAVEGVIVSHPEPVMRWCPVERG
jgi:hypothetical protein